MWCEFLQTQITQKQRMKKWGGVNCEQGRPWSEGWGERTAEMKTEEEGRKLWQGWQKLKQKFDPGGREAGTESDAKRWKWRELEGKKVTSCGATEKDGDGWSIQGQRKLLKSWIQRLMCGEREMGQQDGVLENYQQWSEKSQRRNKVRRRH